MKLLDGERLADTVKEDLSREVSELEESPKLVALIAKKDPASQTYVNMKKEACRKVGMDSQIVSMGEKATEEDLISQITELNKDDEVNGILVQLPLPEHIDTKKIMRSVDPLKDVDGFNPENMGRLVQNSPRFIPATPKGVQRLLDHYNVDTVGKDVVIVNRSDIVGKPLANMLLQDNESANSTVTVCHKYTGNLKSHTRRADILITAVGEPDFITKDMIKEGTVVVDIGISRVEGDNDQGYKVVGDADFEGLREKSSAITPVPGGVGPMTVAMVVENTLKAYKIQEGRDGA